MAKKVKGKKLKAKSSSKLTVFQKAVLRDLQKLNPSRKPLSGKAKAIYAQLKELEKLPPKKKKPISKQARGILNDLNKLYRKKRQSTGFSNNNFNHIRSLLWQHHKIDFKGYKDEGFINTVKQLYNDCKVLGADCTDEAILERYRKLKAAPIRPQPFIDEALFDPQPYFNIKDVEFSSFEPYLWIVSPMIVPTPHEFIITNYYYHYNKLLDAPPEDVEKFAAEIRSKTALSNISKKEENLIFSIVLLPVISWSAADRATFLEIYAKYNEDSTRGYNTYFKDWVDWCNDSMHTTYGSEAPSDKIFFKFTGPATYNTDKERWEVTIIICTGSGQMEDFGFKPTGELSEHEVWQFIEPTPEKLVPPTPIQETEQAQDLTKRKAVANVQNLLNDIAGKAKKIDKKEKELEIRVFLLEEERKEKEIARLTKLATQLRKNLARLEKDLKLAQKMKDSKETKKVYSQIKKLSAELNKISDQLIKLGK